MSLSTAIVEGRRSVDAHLTDDAPRAIYTWHLWGERGSECGICEKWGPHRHAVGWYCEPVKQNPGEPVPEWGPDAIASGRVVCKSCHDRFYGLESAE